MRLRVAGQGIIADGLPQWSAAIPVLQGVEPYQAATLRPPLPAGLPMNERRRAQLATRLALEAGRQALVGGALAERDRTLLQTVFASSDGDMNLIDAMCRDIYQHRQSPSPTTFQNSVHNAVAGYWAIAETCRAGSTSLAAADGSFAAGLLEAATQVVVDGRDVLMVAFDVPAPALLDPHRHFDAPFACALLLRPLGTAVDGPELDLMLSDADGGPTLVDDPVLEAMRLGNPAARGLPLLRAIAVGGAQHLMLPYLDDLSLELRLS